MDATHCLWSILFGAMAFLVVLLVGWSSVLAYLAMPGLVRSFKKRK